MNLNQITIQSQNVNRSLKFYLKLGLQLIVNASPRYIRLACPNGDSTFSVNYSETKPKDTTTLYFEVSDVDQTLIDLNNKGIKTESTPKDQKWLWRELELNDPDGHKLKIYTAGKNRKNPPWQVKQRRWYDAFIESPVNFMK